MASLWFSKKTNSTKRLKRVNSLSTIQSEIEQIFFFSKKVESKEEKKSMTSVTSTLRPQQRLISSMDAFSTFFRSNYTVSFTSNSYLPPTSINSFFFASFAFLR